MKLKEYSIKTQILVSFAAIATLSMIIIAMVAVNNINITSDKVKSESTESLERQILTNMQTGATGNARLIEQKFKNAESAVKKIVQAVEELFSNELNIQERESYHDSELLDIPDATLEEAYDEVISSTTSTYYYPSSEFSGSLTLDQENTVNQSAHLDTLFSSIWNNNREYVWLYVSFDNGIFRNFPGALVDETQSYQPKIADGWHADTMIAGKDVLLYSPPYFDITQGLVVSLTQAVYINNIPIAVVGLDFKTTTIRDKVVDVTFLETGYATLFQSQDLTVISHPLWDPSTQDPDEDVPIISDIEASTNGQSAISNSLILEITNNEAGVSEYVKSDIRYFLAYSPVLIIDNVPIYIFLIIVPENEVFASVDEIQKEIDENSQFVIGTTTTIAIVGLVATLVVGLWLAINMIKPISNLTELANQLTRNVTKEDLFDGVNVEEMDLDDEDEIGDLTRSFTSMVKRLKEDQLHKKKRTDGD